MRRSLAAIFILVFLLLAIDTAPASALPPDFEDTLIAVINAPTDLEWTPDGRVLVTEKHGQLWVVQNGSVVSPPAIDLADVMCNNGERALGGVAVHPNFASNRYIYLYYTFKKNGTCNESEIDGPVNRLSRFVLPASNIIDPASEVVLFDTPPLYRDHHNSGDIAFGNDGYLYVTVGDGGARTLENAEGVSVPQDLGRLLGKIVRLTPTGAIPADNPFTPANGYPDSVRCNLDGVPPPGSPAGAQCQEIYAYGLRNPFRFAFDPNTSATRFFVNDVGQSTWEEISEGAIPGANYGWPAREGPCILKSTTECDPPTDSIDPIHWDIHGPDGGAITGGVFVPNGLWPPQFDNAYLYVSYVEGVIYQLIPGGAGCRSCLPPTSDYIKSTFSASGEVVSMQFGPYGQTEALYYVTRGYGPTSLDGLRRIAYVGAANRAPTALATAAPSSGQAPLDVQFDGTGSSDPDGDPLSYAWDFDDDGSTDSTSPAPSYRYTNGGLYFASLTVNDGQNGEDTTTVRIDVDNMPPVPVIDSPANDATFAVGQVFTLRGTATDAEDGLLPDAALTWEVRQHHNSHYHPFLDVTTGNNIVLQPAPEPEDFEAAANSYLEVLLTATDSGGLSTTVSRDLLPRTVNLSFETTPPGLDLRIGGFTLTAPATVLSWEAHTLQIEAPDQTTESGAFYSWQSWSDGGAQSHTLVAPPAAAAYAATFQESAATSRTFAPTDDTYVRESRATRNYNVDPVVKVDASSRKDGLLRFELSGIAGASIERVVLRLFVDNGSAFGGNFFKANNNNWDEATVTWATAPAADGGLLGSLGRVYANTWAEVDLTGLVSGDGAVSLRITSPNSDGAGYHATENASDKAPELIVTLGESPQPDTLPPSVPANLTVTDLQSTEASLTWDAASDNVGVSGYDLYRNGALLITLGAVTQFRDDSLAPGTVYTYAIRARDAAGNISALSSSVSVTTPSASATITLTPTDDATIRPNKGNYGAKPALEIDASSVKDSLLRFNVSGVGNETVAQVVLRLYAIDGSSSGGNYTMMNDANWSENSVTWQNAPPADGVSLGSIGRVVAGNWYELDVTPLVTGDGPVSLRISSTNANGADYSSKEHGSGNAPELVITLDQGAVNAAGARQEALLDNIVFLPLLGR